MTKIISYLLFLLFPNGKHIPSVARSWPAFSAHASYQNSASSPIISTNLNIRKIVLLPTANWKTFNNFHLEKLSIDFILHSIERIPKDAIRYDLHADIVKCKAYRTKKIAQT
jgi:hypothetical protein